MGMRRSFIIDIHRLALLPITVEWFSGYRESELRRRTR
jgi:hypothetical protein